MEKELSKLEAKWSKACEWIAGSRKKFGKKEKWKIERRITKNLKNSWNAHTIFPEKDINKQYDKVVFA